MTILSPLTRSGSSTDPRDPVARLEKLFDAGTMVPLHDRDKSGLLAAAGDIDGVHTVAYCSDATVMGGAMGVDGSPRVSKHSTPSAWCSRRWFALRVSSHKFLSFSVSQPVAPHTVLL